MRTQSPIRDASPLHKPKVTFHYATTPLRERSNNYQPPSPMSMQKNPTIGP